METTPSWHLGEIQSKYHMWNVGYEIHFICQVKGVKELSSFMPIFVSKLSHNWLKKWLINYTAPDHYLNQYVEQEQSCNQNNIKKNSDQFRITKAGSLYINLSDEYFLQRWCEFSWWRHQMETFAALLAICAGNSPVPGEFPTQRPVTRSFDVFFDLRLNKRLSKQSWGWWFETLSHPLWRHRNVTQKETSN